MFNFADASHWLGPTNPSHRAPRALRNCSIGVAANATMASTLIGSCCASNRSSPIRPTPTSKSGVEAPTSSSNCEKSVAGESKGLLEDHFDSQLRGLLRRPLGNGTREGPRGGVDDGQTLGGWVGLKDKFWDTREIVTGRAKDVDGPAETLLVDAVGGASVVPQDYAQLLSHLGSSHGEAAGVGAEQEVDAVFEHEPADEITSVGCPAAVVVVDEGEG